MKTSKAERRGRKGDDLEDGEEGKKKASGKGWGEKRGGGRGSDKKGMEGDGDGRGRGEYEVLRNRVDSTSQW